MIARGDLVGEILRLCSDQSLHGKQLFRGYHLVGAASEKIHWKAQAREVDLLPEGTKLPLAISLRLYSFSITSR